MAHKKGQGASKNGRDSNSQRLGIKVYEGQFVTAGSILARQRGTKWHPGLNVRRACDDSLFTVVDGFILFQKTNKTTVSVTPAISA